MQLTHCYSHWLPQLRELQVDRDLAVIVEALARYNMQDQVALLVVRNMEAGYVRGEEHMAT